MRIGVVTNCMPWDARTAFAEIAQSKLGVRLLEQQVSHMQA